eukprot:GILI01048474.1.p2 GENE.GILI01048474.1~~GILI01048474.1.p2  ORF type:complete len:103 (-),score=1.97 GILI01048474.1:234-542(-)
MSKKSLLTHVRFSIAYSNNPPLLHNQSHSAVRKHSQSVHMEIAIVYLPVFHCCWEKTAGESSRGDDNQTSHRNMTVYTHHSLALPRLHSPDSYDIVPPSTGQ